MKERILTLLLFFATSLTTIAGQNAMVEEYDLKASYLLNFSKYIEFFSTNSNTVVIGILGDSPLENALQKQVNNCSTKKHIIINKYKCIKSLLNTLNNNPLACQFLFIPKNRQVSSKQLEIINNKNILILGEKNDFIQKGGIMNFVIEQNQLKFEIDANNILNQQFKISPEIMKLACLVEKYPTYVEHNIY